jgi:3-dehydroquinate synthase
MSQSSVAPHSQVVYLKKLPSNKKLAEVLHWTPDTILVIYDRRLEKQAPIKEWLKEPGKILYPVAAGEKLKDLETFSSHIKKMIKAIGPVSPKTFAVVAMGGGTVGDFAGFFASVFKRGVPLVHIPTTLLAGLDSAHGGKTALNVGNIKNQVGSFYSAEAIVLVRELFQSVPLPHIQSGAGELAKMSLLAGGDFFAQVRDQNLTEIDTIWNFLPQAIEAKYLIIQQDPFEKLGDRQLLNLGHTFGHVLESFYDIPHGSAVGLGLVFCVHWSHHHGYLSFADQEVLLEFLHTQVGVPKMHQFLKGRKILSRSRILKLVSADKKMTSPTHVSFIFLEGLGKAFRKTVTIDSFVTEASRQGWVIG